MKELKRWEIIPSVEHNRIVLKDGNKRARYHYTMILQENPDFEVKLILELAEQNSELREAIEERAAIREADGLPGDFYSAVRCNIP